MFIIDFRNESVYIGFQIINIFFEEMKGEKMKNIKKLLLGAVAVTGLGLLASCGGQGAATTTTTVAPTTTTVAPTTTTTPAPTTTTEKYSSEVLADPEVELGETSGYCVAGPGKIGETDPQDLAWARSEAGEMQASSVLALSQLSTTVADSIKDNVSFIYTKANVQLGTEAVAGGYNKNVVEGNKIYVADGGHTFKVISFTFDDELENPYTTKSWFSSAEVHVNNLTPTTLYTLPKVANEYDAAGNDHNGDPAVFKGGLYTIVLVKYKEKVDNCLFGLGAFLTKELTTYGYEEATVTALEKLSIVGKIGGVANWDTGIAMTKGADGKYTAEVTLQAGDEIKVRANDAWDYAWGTAALTAGKDGFVADKDNVTIKADEESATYVVTISVPEQLSVANKTASVFTVVKKAA